MSYDCDRIEEQMLSAVQRYFYVEELKSNADSFIKAKAKEHFPFGALTVLHYQMFGGDNQDIYKAAAAVELMILSSDIFDDLMDNDNFAMPWQQIRPEISMNIAAGLLTLSTLLLGELSIESEYRQKAAYYLNTLILKAVNGQHLDLSNSINSEQEYLDMTLAKSGSLIAAACMAGTCLANTEKSDHEIILEYSKRIGLCVQIQNDIRDFQNSSNKSDLAVKKKTLPILYLLSNPNVKYDPIREYYKGKIENLISLQSKCTLEAIMKESGALDYARTILRINQLQIIKDLDNIAISEEWKQKLLKLI